MAQRCLARLTDVDRTSAIIGCSSKITSQVMLCKNIAEEGNLCEECMSRPSSSVHGLITEPIPDTSRIYGGKLYWTRVSQYGNPSLHWIVQAEAAQKKVESIQGAWKVQRPSPDEIEEMAKILKPKPKAKAKVAVAPAAPAAQAVDKKSQKTLLSSFTPIKVLYEESEKAPEQLPTDSYTIQKSVLEGVSVWITEAGHVFECDSIGEPGKFLGIIVEGHLNPA